jgi:methylenetetrahydrofolate dehydrogenase (NADP+) / methenyltetrahydrofolate cyclohydrolase
LSFFFVFECVTFTTPLRFALMPPKILDGRLVQRLMLNEIHQVVLRAMELTPRRPGLGVVMVGHHGPSQMYIRAKQRAAERCNFHFELHHLPFDASTKDVIAVIEKLNRDPNIDGILTQLPLPKQVTPSHVIQAISPDKDVDGIHPINSTMLSFSPDGVLCPCTALGIRILLDQYAIPVAGAKAVVVGNSAIVGKPTARLLVHGGATVTVCDKYTPDLKSVTRDADLVISGVGKRGLITAEHIKPGATLVDVGIIPTTLGVVGDCDEGAQAVADAVSPVPGGVGPMTIASLLLNTFRAFVHHNTNLLDPVANAAPAFCAMKPDEAFIKLLPDEAKTIAGENDERRWKK